MNNLSTHPKLAVVCYYQLPPGTLNSSLCGFLCCFNAQVKYDKEASAERTRTNRSTEQPCSPRLVSLWRGEQVPLKEEEIREQPSFRTDAECSLCPEMFFGPYLGTKSCAQFLFPVVLNDNFRKQFVFILRELEEIDGYLFSHQEEN
uniref:Uncharacterized protein n=1 Tax=Myotis myotis TaxID=51298 RepID=A0A7J7WVY6_MYOMY|nr:hypothetical protein mMyoMyo1_011947 [Myotis myotis]